MLTSRENLTCRLLVAVMQCTSYKTHICASLPRTTRDEDRRHRDAATTPTRPRDHATTRPRDHKEQGTKNKEQRTKKGSRKKSFSVAKCKVQTAWVSMRSSTRQRSSFATSKILKSSILNIKNSKIQKFRSSKVQKVRNFKTATQAIEKVKK